MNNFFIIILFMILSKNLIGSGFIKYCNNPKKYPDQYNTIEAILNNLNTKNCSDAQKILKTREHLNISGKEIKNIDVILEFTKLRDITITSNTTVDLTGLNQLKNLNFVFLNFPLISFPDSKNNSIIHIKLNSNNLSQISGLENFLKLERIDLINSNKNKIPLNLEVLSKNIHLTYLTFNNFLLNNFESISKLKLKTFISNYSNLVNLDNIVFLKNVNTLSIANSNLENLDFLNFFENLESLGISGNKKIKDFTPITKLIKLEYLYLNSLDLDNIDFLPLSRQLRVIRATDNEIENIDILSKYPKIRKIVLHNNKINKIPDFQNSHLEYLWVNNNNIKYLPDLPKTLKGLLISDNKIKDLSNIQFHEGIADLRIANNKIEDLSMLTKYNYLRYLDISGLNIKDITPIKNNKKLSFLYADNNKISDLDTLANFIYLFEFSLDHNRIESILPLANLHNLRKISLNENPLGTIIEKTEENCPTDAKSEVVANWCNN